MPPRQLGHGKVKRQRRGRAPLGSFAPTLLASPHWQRLLALAAPDGPGRPLAAMTRARPPQQMLVARLWREAAAPAREDPLPTRSEARAGIAASGHWGTADLVLPRLPRATRPSPAGRPQASRRAAGPIWPAAMPRQRLAEQIYARYGQVPGTAERVALDAAGGVGRGFGSLVPEPEPGVATEVGGSGYVVEPRAPVSAEAADAVYRAPAVALEPERKLTRDFEPGFDRDGGLAFAAGDAQQPTAGEGTAAAPQESPSPETSRFVEPIWPRLVAAPYRMPFLSTEGLPTVERFVAPRAGDTTLPQGAGEGGGPTMEPEGLSGFAAPPLAETATVQDGGAGGRLEIPPELAHLPPLLAKLIVSEGRERQRRASEARLPHAQPSGQMAGPFRLAEPRDWQLSQRKQESAGPEESVDLPTPRRESPGTPLPLQPPHGQQGGEMPVPAPPVEARPARRPRISVVEEVTPRPGEAGTKSEPSPALAPREESDAVPEASLAVPGQVEAPRTATPTFSSPSARLPLEVHELADALLLDEAGPAEAAIAEVAAYQEQERDESLGSIPAELAPTWPAGEPLDRPANAAPPVAERRPVQRELFAAGQPPAPSALEAYAAGRPDWRKAGLRDAGRGGAGRAVDTVVAVAEESDRQYLNALFGSIARADAIAPELALAPLGRPAADEAAEAPSAAGEGEAERDDAEAELEEMARKVYGILKTRLAVERERLGGPG